MITDVPRRGLVINMSSLMSWRAPTQFYNPDIVLILEKWPKATQMIS